VFQIKVIEGRVAGEGVETRRKEDSRGDMKSTEGLLKDTGGAPRHSTARDARMRLC
jgi:hypothetical protein